jgi:hypothetical protein
VARTPVCSGNGLVRADAVSLGPSDLGRSRTHALWDRTE